MFDGADIEDLDRVMKDWGFRMGPSETSDSVGHDLASMQFTTSYNSLSEHEITDKHRILKENFEILTKNKWFGVKSGIGY